MNFDKSVFYYGSEILGKRYISVNNLKEFNALLEENPLLNIEAISIKKKHVNSDLINTRIGGLFASEELINRWKDFGITGIRTPQRQKMVVE